MTSKKSILITGCSSGIGYDAAHGLAARGWRVFATCRQETDCARLRQEGLQSFVLDYADETSVSTALAQVLDATGGTLDALFNNGAYALPGAAEDLPFFFLVAPQTGGGARWAAARGEIWVAPVVPARSAACAACVSARSWKRRARAICRDSVSCVAIS